MITYRKARHVRGHTMMESTSILVNKLCLRIARGNDQSENLGVGDIVLGMLYKQISQIFNILFDWRTFSRGGTFITADNRVKGNIQTAHTSDDHTRRRATRIASRWSRRRCSGASESAWCPANSGRTTAISTSTTPGTRSRTHRARSSTSAARWRTRCTG